MNPPKKTLTYHQINANSKKAATAQPKGAGRNICWTSLNGVLNDMSGSLEAERCYKRTAVRWPRKRQAGSCGVYREAKGNQSLGFLQTSTDGKCCPQEWSHADCGVGPICGAVVRGFSSTKNGGWRPNRDAKHLKGQTWSAWAESMVSNWGVEMFWFFSFGSPEKHLPSKFLVPSLQKDEPRPDKSLLEVKER